MADENCAIGRGVAAIRHKSGSRSFTYYCMYSFEAVFAHFEAEGTVLGSIGKKDFHNLACVVPRGGLSEAFEQLCGPVDETIAHNKRASRTLAALRDALLPKLVSGEVRVRNVEELVGWFDPGASLFACIYVGLMLLFLTIYCGAAAM